jgi:hypothetical protein
MAEIDIGDLAVCIQGNGEVSGVKWGFGIEPIGFLKFIAKFRWRGWTSLRIGTWIEVLISKIAIVHGNQRQFCIGCLHNVTIVKDVNGGHNAG